MESFYTFSIEADKETDITTIKSTKPIVMPSLTYNGASRTLNDHSYVTKADVDGILSAAASNFMNATSSSAPANQIYCKDLYVDNVYMRQWPFNDAGQRQGHSGDTHRPRFTFFTHNDGVNGDFHCLAGAENSKGFEIYVNGPPRGTRVPDTWFPIDQVASDDRLKHNEVNIVNALSVILQLQPQTYDMGHTLLDAEHTGEVAGTTRRSGFIAQDVADIAELAHAVTGDATSTTPMRLDYNSIFTHAVAAIQELSAQVAALTARVADLER